MRAYSQEPTPEDLNRTAVSEQALVSSKANTGEQAKASIHLPRHDAEAQLAHILRGEKDTFFFLGNLLPEKVSETQKIIMAFFFKWCS